MEPLIGLFSVLLAASATMFFWLTLAEGRRTAVNLVPSASAGALEDLVVASHPLLPHTIRQTPLN